MSTTRISNNASESGRHTPLTPRSATRPWDSTCLICLSHHWFPHHLFVVSAAISPRASLSSLCLCVINSPFLQSRACPKLNWVPQPSQLEGILRRSRQNHNEYLGTQQQTGQTGGVLCPFHPLLSWLPVCSWCPSALELPLASFGFAPSSVSLGLPLLLLYHYDYHYYYLLYHYYYYHYY